MKMNRILMILLSLTIVMQATILYRQSRPPTPASSSLMPVDYAPPNGARIDLAELPMEGSNEADVVLVEFTDYECPFCRSHATGVFKDLQEYVATGRIRYAVANNPLTAIHPNARFLAKLAICAGFQGYHSEIHEQLFQLSRPADVTALVDQFAMDSKEFESCINDSPVPDQRIDSEIQKARELGLEGTPGFALGRVDSDGSLRVTALIRGAVSLSVFEEAINEVLNDAR